MNFVCIVFKLGDKMLTLSSMELQPAKVLSTVLIHYVNVSVLIKFSQKTSVFT